MEAITAAPAPSIEKHGRNIAADPEHRFAGASAHPVQMDHRSVARGARLGRRRRVTASHRRACVTFGRPRDEDWTGYTMQAADMNGDGCVDLVWNSLGTINRTYVDLSNCDGTFRRAVTALDQPEHGWPGFQMLVRDVSGDHRADIVWNFTGWINATYVSRSQL